MAEGGGKRRRRMEVAEEYELAARPNRSRIEDVSEATWITRKQVAILQQPRGKVLQTMGHMAGDDGAARQWQLLPEEALFMVQQGLLAMRNEKEARAMAVTEAMDRVFSGGMSPFFFHAYAKIRDAGFVAARAEGNFHGRPLLHVWKPELSKKWRKSQPSFVMGVVRCSESLSSSSCEELVRLQSRSNCPLRMAMVDDSFAVTFFDVHPNPDTSGAAGNPSCEFP